MSDDFRYALPGLMPLTTPKADATSVLDWNLPVKLKLGSIDASVAPFAFTAYIQLQHGGHKLAEGATITNEVASDSRTYFFEMPRRSLPPGTHILDFRADAAWPVIRHVVRVPFTLGMVPAAAAVTSSEPVATITLLWNPDTQSFFELGVEGELGQLTVKSHEES